MSIIKATDWNGDEVTLINVDTGKPVHEGERVSNFRGLPCKVIGGSAPHKSSSQGFVRTNNGEHYAGVYGLKWSKI